MVKSSINVNNHRALTGSECSTRLTRLWTVSECIAVKFTSM